jgi:hypothetical protein
MFGHELHHRRPIREQEAIRDDHEPVGTSLLDHGQGAVQLLGASHLDWLELHAQRLCRRLNSLPRDRGEGVGRIEQRDHPRQRRHRLLEEFEALPLQLRRQRG